MFIPIGFMNLTHIHETLNAAGQMMWSVGFSTTETPDPGIMADLLTEWEAAELRTDYISSNVGQTVLRGTWGTGVPSEPIVAESLAGSGGGAAGQAVPNNTALLIRKRTDRGGRRGRGRAFLPPTQADAVDGGALLSSVIAAAASEAFADLMVAYSTVLGGVPHLLHTTEAGGAPDEITGFSCDTRVATQRRRLRD